ncbi:MAG: glycine zipper domain-containing protein [Thermoguttaceae bacterium]
MTRIALSFCWAGLASTLLLSAGCQPENHTERGALFGSLFGAGTGAVIGGANGNPVAGAAIGAAAGALGGAAVGSAMDDAEAKNRELIAQQMGRQVAPGAVTVADVIAMSAAHVHEELIITHIHRNGAAAPLRTSDLIQLQQSGVSARVISTMQSTPVRQVQGTVVIRQSPPPAVIVETPPPCWGPPHPHPYAW